MADEWKLRISESTDTPEARPTFHEFIFELYKNEQNSVSEKNDHYSTVLFCLCDDEQEGTRIGFELKSVACNGF
jgi:hypothetical protein